MIQFKRGYKYQLVRPWKWKVQSDLTILSDFRNRYYWASAKRREIGAYVGCAWDGATWFPDFDWIIEGSLGHDIFHWLIAKGIVPESDNPLIDRELAAIIRERGGDVPEWLINFRASYVRRATGFVDQKQGDEKPIITLPR